MLVVFFTRLAGLFSHLMVAQRAAYLGVRSQRPGEKAHETVQLRTQPLCAGTVVPGPTETFRIQSAGGSNTGYAFTEAERIGLMQQLQRAARESTRVRIRANNGDFGVFTITFFGN
jgi:hypothetical protein